MRKGVFIKSPLMDKKIPWHKTETAKYALAGALFGCCFPIMATSVDMLAQGLSFNWQNIKLVQNTQPLHWIIDTAPIFLGLFASIAGRKQDSVKGINRGLEQTVADRTAEISRQMEEQKRQNWLKTGETELNLFLSGEKDIYTLANEAVRQICKYTDARIGAIYAINDTNQYELAGSFAFRANEQHPSTISPGEGLVGQVAIDKSILMVNDVPEGYFNVESGTGQTNISTLVVYPLIFENITIGVIELGYLDKFDQLNQEYIEAVGENISIAFNTSKVRAQVNKLLETTQKQAAELEAQQEELRQSNEELESQQEELRQANEELQEQTLQLQQSEEELKTQQEEIMQINNELEEKARQLEEKNLAIIQKNSDLEITKRELEQKAEDLAITSKYKSEFLANMSHELRTPLNSIILLSKLLQDNPDERLSKEQVEFAQIILNSGNGLLELINEILDLSKIEAGRMDVDIEEEEISSIKYNMESLFSALADDKKVKFSVNVGKAVPETIKTDRLRIEQVVKNLLSNAFKFTDKSGSVILDIYVPDKKHQFENPELLHDNGVVAFAVKDTGIGIPEEKQKAVFEAFMQADGSTKRKYGGTGLGLSISREIAGMLGGELQLTSKVGEGSTFTLYVPFESQPTAIDEEEQTEVIRRPEPIKASKPVEASAELDQPLTFERPEPPTETVDDDQSNLEAGDRKILIVEDDVHFAKLLLQFARERGYKGIVATQGDIGLEYAQKYRPDAILLDNMLPVMDGMTVIDSLKADPELRHIPVHFMSALDRKQLGLKKGALGYLTKPLTKEQILGAFDTIEAFVEKEVKRVLVVDDNQAIQKAISSYLGTEEIECITAQTGDEALEKIAQGLADCVVLDMGLPDISGYDLLEKIKTSEVYGNIPVIIYTGKDLSRQEENKIRNYASAIVIKTANSYKRLLDETKLFLHRVDQKMGKVKDPTSKPYSAEKQLQGKTALVVDDDIRNIFALTKVLEAQNMEVVSANDGVEALQELEKNKNFDVVLMDIMMPNMDGYEAMQEIRKKSKFRNLPIIALTAKAMIGDREKCIKAGASDYISKPLDADKLLSLLRVWLYK